MSTENDIGAASEATATGGSQIPTDSEQPQLDIVAPVNKSPRAVWIEWVRQGLRASIWRRIRNLPLGPSAAQMGSIWLICALIEIALQRLAMTGDVEFSFSSWVYHWASTGLAICGVWLIVNWRPTDSLHASPVAAWFLLTTVSSVPAAIIYMLVTAALHRYVDWSMRSWLLTWGLYILVYVWILGGIWRAAQGVSRSKIVTLGVASLWTGLIIIAATVLNFPVWRTNYHFDENDKTNASLTLSQEVFESQQALLTSALSNIKPHEGKDRQMYALVYAPYSQDVFLRESSMVQEVLERTFGAQNRIVRLANHPSVTAKIPWATTLNMKRTVTAIAGAMDRERDILVMYLTSHGGADFVLATQYYPLETEGLKASQLRTMLDKVGIRNRVIIISACYSGGWVEQLRNDSTLVMTAADKDHTSYGCGNKSELTFFGRALFDEQLRKTNSFVDAFNAAAPIIRQRETEAGKDDGFSNPQIAVGEDIAVVLKEWADEQSVEK